MRFSCDSCQTRYTIADEKVRGKILRVRCKRCGNVILLRELDEIDDPTPLAEDDDSTRVLADDEVRRDIDRRSNAVPSPARVAPRPVAAPPHPVERPRAPVERKEWYVIFSGKEVGPMTRSELRARAERGEVSPRTYAWHEGMPQWQRMNELPPLADVLALMPRTAGITSDLSKTAREADRAREAHPRADEAQRAAETKKPRDQKASQVEEELRAQKDRFSAQARQAEDERRAAALKAADEARKAEEAKRAEDERRAAALKATEEARKAEEAKRAEDERRAAALKAAEEALKAEEAKRAEDERRAAALKAAEDARKAEEAKRAEDERRAAALKAAEEARKAEEAKRAEDEGRAAALKVAEEARKAEEAKRAEEERRAAALKAAEEARKAEEAKRAEDEGRAAALKAAEEAPKAKDAKRAKQRRRPQVPPHADEVTPLTDEALYAELAKLSGGTSDEEPTDAGRRLEEVSAEAAPEVPGEPAEEPITLESIAEEVAKEIPAEPAKPVEKGPPAAKSESASSEAGRSVGLEAEGLQVGGAAAADPFANVPDSPHFQAAAPGETTNAIIKASGANERHWGRVIMGLAALVIALGAVMFVAFKQGLISFAPAAHKAANPSVNLSTAGTLDQGAQDILNGTAKQRADEEAQRKADELARKDREKTVLQGMVLPADHDPNGAIVKRQSSNPTAPELTPDQLAAMLGMQNGGPSVTIKPLAPEGMELNKSNRNTGGPDPKVLQAKIAENKQALDLCISAALNRDPTLNLGRVNVTATIGPSGIVTSAVFSRADVGDMDVGHCLRGVIKRIVFPAFSGNPVDVEIPLMIGNGG